jgi:transcription elongation factor Elf1
MTALLRMPGTPAWNGAALTAIAAFRRAPDKLQACPSCDAPSLGIADRSAPPHAMWMVLSCSSCGLQHTLNIPMGHTGGTHD